MKILLISPKGTFFSHSSEFVDYLTHSREMQTILHYWSGIGTSLPIIAGVTPGNHEITIVDENLEPLDFEASYDIVGITGMTQQANRAYEIADEYKKKGRYVVLGGIHATVLPDEAKTHVDTVFVGEGENTWPWFIRDYIQGTPKAFYRQSDHASVKLKQIPQPRYDLISKYSYPVIWVQASRGCPYDCEFCAASKIFGKRYKHKTIAQIVGEIEDVKSRWKFAQVGFADDNMFINKKFSSQLVDEFKKMNFTWYAQSDLTIARSETFLRDLHVSGCRILFIGFESVNPENLKDLNKNRWKAKLFSDYSNSIKRIQENGIGIYGSFILGFDSDVPSIFDQTIDFINENHLLGAQITILTPLPGSRLRIRLDNENRIATNDWQAYTGWNALIKHKSFSEGDLEAGLLKIYKNIYSQENYRKRASYFRKICQDLIK